MSKSRSFSIYLLKEGRDATNSLKDDHRLDEGVAATSLPAGSTLFVLDNIPREPWWKSYFGVRKTLMQATKGALIFLPVGDRCFALSFGHVFHNLDDASYEYDFGLKVTLNSVDPQLLKSTDVVEPGSARRRRTQVPVDSDLTYFDFDRDSTILKSLTGKVKSAHKELFKHATGSSNLRISTSLPPSELPDLCEKLLELYASEEHRTTFPDIQNVVPVRDPVLIDSLNVKLLEALHGRDETLNLAVPDLINYSDNVYATFNGCGGGDLYEDVFTERYITYLEEKGQDVATLTLEDLKRHKLKLVDEENTPKGSSYSILKCLVFDTELAGGAGTFHISEGNWFKVEDNYIQKLSDYLDPLCHDLTLPEYNHETEGAYNQFVEDNDDSFLCLDMKNISPTGQTQIEPCDILTVEGELAVFYHIKVSTFSSQLSHLFNQGTNAVELLKLEEESRDKLIGLVDASTKTDENKGFLKVPLATQKYTVMFGIVTHKDKVHKSLNLPLFSRISLMRNMKTLQMMSIPAVYGFIEDQSPKKAGKTKKKKKKGDAAND